MPSLGVLRVNKNFSGLATIDFGEDVSTATMTARVYSVSPKRDRDGTLLDPGTVLFTKAMQPIQGQATQQGLPLTATDTGTPRAPLYGEIDVVFPGQTNDCAQLFTFAIDGR